jgi:hypothetical protein
VGGSFEVWAHSSGTLSSISEKSYTL